MSHFRKKFPFTLAFTTGMCIMAVELTASRLLAPFFGTSLFVWTNVIAVIMVALAVGYWLGGKISERRPELTVLLKIVLLGGILCFIIPFITEPFSILLLKDISAVTSASWLILIGSFAATLLLFFLPIMLLGMTSPYLIKIISITHPDVGNVAGTVFAVSTIGSIVGTFLPSIIFISWIGSKKTILVFAVILILISAVGLARRKHYAYLGLIIFTLGPIVIPASLRPEAATILETESVYQYIQVQEHQGMRYLVYNEGTGTQSVYHPDKIITGHMYFDIMAASPALFEDNDIDVLNIGLAGGTAVRSMTHLFDGYKEINIDGVEIDSKVVGIAQEYFDLNLDNLNIFVEDGRIFSRSSNKTYDLILVDAYSNQIYIPWHLTTDEFFSELEGLLNEKGIVALNLNATSNESELYQAVTNTMAHNFDYVFSAPIPGSFNYLIFASNQSIEFRDLLGHEAIGSNQELANLIMYLVENVEAIMYNQEHILLTDDRAPVEHMTDQMYWEYIINNIK
ncbi:hypothetical protein GWN26_13595 [Candidatus Saccharibacteria bacterium]|nr:hypothetical protein [Candidatus Saccharibacteria bacterium]NIV04350.1 hypothetical protein [Calditrichia bacterium]NIS38891.1 hypothetical protein [Candidatus Saccharibacteria bacterium]NIV72875.1 hypothetical protein [Calditrichia bacterium]NIW00091.1 hypothetical protein [Candidatus Saccharibacteria bacterium]